MVSSQGDFPPGNEDISEDGRWSNLLAGGNRGAGARSSARQALLRYLDAGRCTGVSCFTDAGRMWLAQAFVQEATAIGLRARMTVLPEPPHDAALGLIRRTLATLGERDLVVSAFSWTGSPAPYLRVFPNLRSPDGFRGFSAAVRQRYPDEALLTAMITDPRKAEAVVTERSALSAAARVLVTTPAGTHLEFGIGEGKVLPFKIGDGCRHVLLPPSEISFGIVPGDAEGMIVADVTVGEFVVGGRVLDPLGLVDRPVRIEVAGGYVVGIAGGRIARRLERCFAGLADRCRLLVELGFGLSQGTPTGCIGADECLQGTCHFGIGDDFFHGAKNPAPVHLDVVCAGPEVSALPSPAWVRTPPDRPQRRSLRQGRTPAKKC